MYIQIILFSFFSCIFLNIPTKNHFYFQKLYLHKFSHFINKYVFSKAFQKTLFKSELEFKMKEESM